MRIQKESVFEKRPQLNSFLFFGGIGLALLQARYVRNVPKIFGVI